MKDQLLKLTQEALAKIASSKTLDEINEARVEFLGKKGQFTTIMKEMKNSILMIFQLK